ncbi:MAG: trypsin-like peptidase domain-containing protein [Phycisphaeraceae bacterium]|nr:trypsin-like peptidase domain-containing protein [Phycisphaeraceae bacterium]
MLHSSRDRGRTPFLGCSLSVLVLFGLSGPGWAADARLQDVPGAHGLPHLTELAGSRGPVIAPGDGDAIPQVLAPARPGDAHRALRVDFLPFDPSPFLAEDAIRDRQAGTPRRIGVQREIPGGFPIDAVRAEALGAWTQGPHGTRLWTATLHVPGAYGVRVHFAELDLPPGGVVVVAGTDGRADAYTGRPEGDVWAMAVPGAWITIQYQAPLEADGAPRIVIDEISHLYRPHHDPLGAVEDPPATPHGAAAGGLLPCHQDVMCHTPDAVARDSVATMDFVSGGGTFVCSAGLLNDVDTNTDRGLVLTANHCISTPAEANSATIYWFYQRNGCGGSIPSIFSVPRSNGAAFLAGSTNTDFTLMRTLNDPADGQGFAGWSILNPGSGAAVTGIHHPGGSWKRISFGNLTTQNPICGGLPTVRYWYLKWTQGVTEGGSSGSPLFNANWQVIGQLFGICGNDGGCNQSNHNNVYGRLNVTYPSISTILNEIVPDDEYEQNDTLGDAAAIVPGVHGLHLVDFFDWFSVEVPESSIMTVSAAKSLSDMSTQLWLRRTDGSAIGGSLANIAVQTATVAVLPGTYLIEYRKMTGWGGPYTLTITLAPDCNENGVADATDIGNGTSQDINGNGIPDECEEPKKDPCPADIDGSGTVDFADVLALLAAWGPCGGDCPEDIDASGTVDFNDLLQLLAAWGPCE